MLDRKMFPSQKLSATFIALLALSLLGCDSATPTGVDQAPVEFSTTNKATSARYLSWNNSSGSAAFLLERQVKGVWQATGYVNPTCTARCSDKNQGQDCRVMCGAMMPMVKTIDAGATASVSWTGKVFPSEETHCSQGRCFRESKPEAGHYRVTVCAYDAFTCMGSPCPPTDPLFGGQPSGNKTCYSTELDVPYAQKTVLVTIKP